MEIKAKAIKVKDLFEGYSNEGENGVVAYGGNLDIRPPYQREFIYNDEQREKVIETVMSGYPLNTMYWAKRKDGTFEIIDGQQRTMSICQYVNNDFSYKFRSFQTLQADEKERILNYKLFVYVCDGDDSEKLKWFETINIAGAELTKQELRNAVYSGKWVTSAKSYFSKTNCAAYNIGSKYLNGEMKRQSYLETAIKWISQAKNEDDIKNYMSEHCADPDAQPLFSYFRNVIEWIQAKFPKWYKVFLLRYSLSVHSSEMPCLLSHRLHHHIASGRGHLLDGAQRCQRLDPLSDMRCHIHPLGHHERRL